MDAENGGAATATDDSKSPPSSGSDAGLPPEAIEMSSPASLSLPPGAATDSTSSDSGGGGGGGKSSSDDQQHPARNTAATTTAAAAHSSDNEEHGADDGQLSAVAYEHCGAHSCCCRCLCLPLPLHGHSAAPNDGTDDDGDDVDAGRHKRRPACLTAGWWLYRVLAARWVHPWRIAHSYFFDTTLVPRLVRAVLLPYAITVLVYGVASDPQDGYWFAYFTHLSYLGLVVYLTLASYITWEWWWFVERQPVLGVEDMVRRRLTGRRARPIDLVTTLLYSMAIVFHVIVPLVYWLLLADTYSFSLDSPVGRWMQLSQHALDFVVMFIEFTVNRIVLPWSHLLILLLVMVAYILWTWAAAAIWPGRGSAGNGFPYFFVNYNKPLSFAYIVGLALVFSLIYAAVWAVHVGRRRLALLLGRRASLRGALDSGPIEFVLVSTASPGSSTVQSR